MTASSTLSPQSRQRIESHRRRNGQFGEYHYAEPVVNRGAIPDAELIPTANRIARATIARLCQDLSISPDDVAMEAVLEVLEYRRKADEQRAAARRDGIAYDLRPVDEPGLLSMAVHGRATQAIRKRQGQATTSGREVSAYREYSRAVAAWEAEHHREMPASQRQIVADSIRMSRPEGERPVADFWQRRAFTPLDSPTITDGSVPSVGSAEDDYLAREQENSALEQLDLPNGNAAFIEAKRTAWVTIASSTGAPVPVEHSLTRRQATAIRKLVEAEGGIRQVIRTMSDGEETPATEAVGKMLGIEYTRDVIALRDLSDEYPDYIDGMFQGAVHYATVPRSKKEATL